MSSAAPNITLWTRENIAFIGIVVAVIYVLITTLNALPWVSKAEHEDLKKRVDVIETRQTDVLARLSKLEASFASMRDENQLMHDQLIKRLDDDEKELLWNNNPHRHPSPAR